MTIVRPLHYLKFDPFESIRQLSNDFGDLLWESVNEVSSGRPPMNIWYDQDKAILEAEMPGVKSEDLDIEVLENNLTIKATRKKHSTENCIREERPYGTYSRNFQLPFNVNVDGVEASLRSGILRVTLPRMAEQKPKKVEITMNH